MEVMWEDAKNTRCKKCNYKLAHFQAYIPNLGEVCMKCYVYYAQEMERQGK